MAPKPQAGVKVQEKRSEADSRGLHRFFQESFHWARSHPILVTGSTAQQEKAALPSKEHGKEKNGSQELGGLFQSGFKAGADCGERDYRLRPHAALSSEEAREAKASLIGSLRATPSSIPSTSMPQCHTATPSYAFIFSSVTRNAGMGSEPYHRKRYPAARARLPRDHQALWRVD